MVIVDAFRTAHGLRVDPRALREQCKPLRRSPVAQRPLRLGFREPTPASVGGRPTKPSEATCDIRPPNVQAVLAYALRGDHLRRRLEQPGSAPKALGRTLRERI